MRTSRGMRIVLVILLCALALMLLLPAAMTHAETPTPTATAAVTTSPPATTTATGTTAPATTAPSTVPSTTSGTPTPTPVGQTPFESNYQPPCPNPTPTPTPVATPSPIATPTPVGQTPSPSPVPSPTRHPNLCPATLSGGSPTDLLAVLFTPIFQAIFIVLAGVYDLSGDIGIAIIVVTIAIRLLLIPLFRRQIVSQRRLQALQPELSEIRRRYKGDRNKQSQEQMKLYSERGVNPAAGCLPSLMQLFLLLPMYYVFTAGLQAPDISSMLTVFGVQLVNVTCQAPGNALVPCINPTLHWLFDLNASQPAVFFHILGFGVSIIAVISALLQLVQSRMMMPPATDQQARAQQQAFMIVPLISIVYGSFLPAGLFIYWIVTTIFSIVQQYLTVGWGSLFPLFGWTPRFAVDHTPRFGVPDLGPPRAVSTTPKPASARDPRDAAAGTVRPAKSRGRTSRRGRRR